MKILRYNITSNLKLILTLVDFEPLYGIVSGNTTASSIIRELTKEESRTFDPTLSLQNYNESNKLNPNAMFEFITSSSIDARNIYKIDDIEFVLPSNTESPIDAYNWAGDANTELIDVVKELFPNIEPLWKSATSLDILLQEYKTGNFLNEFAMTTPEEDEFFNYFIANPDKFVWDTAHLMAVPPSVTIPRVAITEKVLNNFRNFAPTAAGINSITLATRLRMYDLSRGLKDGNSILLAWYATFNMDSYDYRRLSFAVDEFATLFYVVAERLGYQGSFWYSGRVDHSLLSDSYLEDTMDAAALEIDDFRDAAFDLASKHNLIGLVHNLGLSKVVNIELI